MQLFNSYYSSISFSPYYIYNKKGISSDKYPICLILLFLNYYFRLRAGNTIHRTIYPNKPERIVPDSTPNLA